MKKMKRVKFKIIIFKMKILKRMIFLNNTSFMLKIRQLLLFKKYLEDKEKDKSYININSN